jgi:hypothetical protein
MKFSPWSAYGADVILHRLEADRHEFARATGWSVEPRGACTGDVCVPLPASAQPVNGRLDVRLLAERLGMPLVSDPEHGVYALGPSTAATGRALSSAVAPDLELPAADGNPFHLSSLLGKKVLLVAWASW